MKKKKGFTLIEIIFVLAIISIIVIFAENGISGLRENQDLMKLNSNLKLVYETTVDLYSSRNHSKESNKVIDLQKRLDTLSYKDKTGAECFDYNEKGASGFSDSSYIYILYKPEKFVATKTTVNIENSIIVAATSDEVAIYYTKDDQTVPILYKKYNPQK
ncbi:type II secretion system protein [Clostridium tertium]|uniref:type II secretion system protein n=1 Tax=Clostridium tertium TaxID=1559 RepID=UPI0023B2B1B8|nr:type II secretion system protein [Clostridium tertium]